MKYLLVIFLLLPLALFGEGKEKSKPKRERREKGEVFKRLPTTPTENLDKSGLIVVDYTMYGLRYEDDSIPQEAKDKVEAFFSQRNVGYTSVKLYELQIERVPGESYWYIEGHKVE